MRRGLPHVKQMVVAPKTLRLLTSKRRIKRMIQNKRVQDRYYKPRRKLPMSDFEGFVRTTDPAGGGRLGKRSKKKPKIGAEMKDRQQNGDGNEDDENHGNTKVGDGAKDKQSDVSNTGKIEAKPGLFVTPSELAQLKTFLPGFKSVPNERLYKVLPRLMSKTPGDLPKNKKSNLDNRPRWK